MPELSRPGKNIYTLQNKDRPKPVARVWSQRALVAPVFRMGI